MFITIDLFALLNTVLNVLNFILFFYIFPIPVVQLVWHG